MPKVHKMWKREHRAMLFELAWKLLTTAGNSKRHALELAQDQMIHQGIVPTDKRRKIYDVDCQKLRSYVEERGAYVPLPPIAGAEPAATGTTDPLIAAVTKPGVTNPDEHRGPHFDPAVVRTGMLIENLRTVIHEVFIRPLQEAVAEGAYQGTKRAMDEARGVKAEPQPEGPKVEEAATKAEAPAQETVKREPKILIISNMERPLDAVRREFPNVDFRFVHCDNSRQIESASQSVDATYVMTKFVGHSAQRSVRGRCILIPPTSGQSALIRNIAEKFPNTFRRVAGNGAGVAQH